MADKLDWIGAVTDVGHFIKHRTRTQPDTGWLEVEITSDPYNVEICDWDEFGQLVADALDAMRKAGLRSPLGKADSEPDAIECAFEALLKLDATVRKEAQDKSGHTYLTPSSGGLTGCVDWHRGLPVSPPRR